LKYLDIKQDSRCQDVNGTVPLFRHAVYLLYLGSSRARGQRLDIAASFIVTPGG
jgi:hypothetical protein